MAPEKTLNKPSHPIASDTEFNRLRSIIVGSARGANHPEPFETSFRHFFTPPDDKSLSGVVRGPIPQGIVDEIEEDLAALVTTLEKAGVEVFRPESFDSSVAIQSPYWESEQLYSLMPRDVLLVIGQTLIEVPSATRARYFEVFPFRSIIQNHRQSGRFRWLSAPKPQLREECYPEPQQVFSEASWIRNHEILFDGANCVRIGRDIFIDINLSANMLAAEWLQYDVLGDSYRVHTMHLGHDHADVTLIPIRPGLLLVDPQVVTDETIPAVLRNWDRIELTQVPELPYSLAYPMASSKVGINLLMLDHDTAIVEESQHELIRALEKRRITAIPLRYRHGRTLGGAFHCVTLDLNRDGVGETYL